MKILSVLTLIACLTTLEDGPKCPPKGDSQRVKLQVLDTLKNRNEVSNIVRTLTLDEVLKTGDDTKRFSDITYVTITGYVYDVKYGGPETCNCHTQDKSQLDIHIEIVKDLKDAAGPKRMIVEINRFVRASKLMMDYPTVKLLKGKKVEISGWMFFDEEHKQNAINTSPNGTNVWRATCWEVHPCMSIHAIQ
jgi:hypothetical protein